MATITHSAGDSLGSTELVTNTKLHNLVDNATITGIVNADIDAAANIDGSKLNISITTLDYLVVNDGGTGISADINKTGASGNVVDITNDGTGTALKIDNNSSGNALSIFHDATVNSALYMENNGNSCGIYIEQNGVLAASRHGLYVYSNAAQTAAALVQIYIDNASSTRPALNITNDGSSSSLNIAQTTSATYAVQIETQANAPHIHFSGDPTVASPADGDFWYNGSKLFLLNGTATERILSNSYAWVNFAGGTATIANSYNVTSVGDNGTGDYTITWDIDFADTSYVIAGGTIEIDGTNGGGVITVKFGTTLAAGSVNILTVQCFNGVAHDGTKNWLMAIGA